MQGRLESTHSSAVARHFLLHVNWKVCLAGGQLIIYFEKKQ